MKTFLSVLAISTLSNLSIAQDTQTSGIDTSRLYAGGGFHYNRIDTSSLGGVDGKATGLQGFAGYEMGNRNGFDLATEVGFIQSDEYIDGTNEDADGFWVSAVGKKDLPEVNSKLSAIARIGYGIGGDDGLFMGFGAQFQPQPKVIVRAEYLNKDLSQSFQLNAAYQF
jgi:hypothetical protein